MVSVSENIKIVLKFSRICYHTEHFAYITDGHRHQTLGDYITQSQIIFAVEIKNSHLNGPIVYQLYNELLPCNVPSMTTLNKLGQQLEVVFPVQIVKHSNAIGYVTSNFIG